MVAGLYWLERRTLGYDLYAQTTVATRLLLVVVNILPMLFALLSLRKSLRQLKVSTPTRWYVLMAAGFASMLNPFLTTLNNHTPAAVCLLFSLAAIVRIKGATETRPRDFAIVGFTAALTCCFELPAASFGALSFLLVVSVDWRKTAGWYVPAALIPLAAFFITNWICTGGIKPFYSFYGTDKYVYVHEGVPSYWSEPQGMDANQESTPVYLFHCVLGHHGILALTPVFLLTLAGWTLGLDFGRAAPLRAVLWLGAGISLVVLIFYLTRTENYNYGGNSSALRWMLWLTPSWWYGMVPAVEGLVKSRGGRAIAGLLLLLSAYAPAYSLTQPWRPPWLFDRMEQAEWIDYGTTVLPFEPRRYAVLNRIPMSGVTNSFHGDLRAKGNILTVTAAEAVHIRQMPATVLNVSFTPSPEQAGQQATVVALLPGARCRKRYRRLVEELRRPHGCGG